MQHMILSRLDENYFELQELASRITLNLKPKKIINKFTVKIRFYSGKYDNWNIFFLVFITSNMTIQSQIGKIPN